MISLYIHTSHDGSVTAIKNRKILFHHQIDRFNKFKHTSAPHFRFIKELIDINEPVNKLHITHYPKDNTTYFWQKVLTRLRIIDKKTKIYYCDDKHHIFHACCAKLFYPRANFYFVWDQQGANTDQGIEQETLYTNKLNKIYSHNREENYHIGFGERYAIATRTAGFNELEDGKTMALAQYKKPGVAYFEQKRLEKKSVQLFKTLKLLHFKKGDTVCLTGGVTQNVVNNSKIQNALPDINFVADPFNGDFGISLGAAHYHENLLHIPLKNIYTGFSTEIDLTKFSKYKQKLVSHQDVCKILQKDVVAMFQSKSEQGQRGLGNRSLLIDIEAPNALKKMNTIKKREWFRPFACTIMEDKAEEWFDTKGKISPFMMFVFKSKKPKKTKNVTCVNNTSRVQTLPYSHNYHFSNLLWHNNKHYKKPLLLNTSLNLPGHTLVETLDDMLYMFEKTKLKYIYFPEERTLVYK